MKDEILAKRRMDLLQALATPRTLDEVESELGITYWTLWRMLQPMLEEGSVKELHWRRDRKKLFCASGQDSSGVINIITKTGAHPIGVWTHNLSYEVGESTILRQYEDVSGVLSQVWRYCMYSQSKNLDNARAGANAPVKLKSYVREVLELHKRLQLVLEQILLAPIWSETVTPETARRFGPVDESDIMQIASEFERKHGI